jgi:hypothetical protein
MIFWILELYHDKTNEDTMKYQYTEKKTLQSFSIYKFSLYVIYRNMYVYKLCFKFSTFSGNAGTYTFFLCYEWAGITQSAMGWTIGWSGFDSQWGLGIFLFNTVSRLALGPTQPLV